MDVMVTAAVAVILSIVAALIALFKKKKFWKILIYAFIGLIVGFPVGYFLAPTIVSFF